MKYLKSFNLKLNEQNKNKLKWSTIDSSINSSTNSSDMDKIFCIIRSDSKWKHLKIYLQKFYQIVISNQIF